MNEVRNPIRSAADSPAADASRPLKVLVVTIDLAGGTGTFCRILAAGLKRYHGGEFTTPLLLLRDREVTDADQALFDGVSVIGSNVNTDWRRWVEAPLHARRLRRAVRDSDADVIFTVGAYANMLAPRGARGRPVVLSVHVHATRQLRDTRFGDVTGWLMRRLYRRYPVVTPASDVSADLQAHFNVRRAVTIPHGIDTEAVASLSTERVDDLPARAPYLAACGRLTLQKDYATLIRAYARARGQGVAEDLVIIGEGDERPALQQLIDALGLSAHVHLIGHRPNPFPYMRGARFFVLSSVWEGFGLVLLEAMALGLPCVSTDCPSGPGEILRGGESGVLVPTGDEAALGNALVRLAASEEERRRFRERSLVRASELSLERMARAYRDLFVQELADVRERGGGR